MSRWKKGQRQWGREREREGYEVVQRVRITAVGPNLIRAIVRIKVTKRSNQLDLFLTG